MKMILAALVAFCLAPSIALAHDERGFEAKQSEQAFDDVVQATKDAIVAKGYVIDYHGFIGDMLKRTGPDVGSTEVLYEDAEFFTFCSAVLSRKMMEADPVNIAHCPYVVFVYQKTETNETTVGYRKLPSGPAFDPVTAALEEIITAGAEGF